MRYLVPALPLLFAACSAPGPREGGSGAIMLNGAGATFPYPIYAKWFDEYHRQRPDARINYQAIGSGGGIRQLQAGTVDFGASDMPVGDAELAKFPVPVLHFPTVAGAVVPMYNLPGVAQDLNFTPRGLAGIMLGTIRKWNDPEIAGANPGTVLPAADIVVVHRSDGSGTTFIWTDFLSRVSPEWKSKVGVGTSVSWPVGLGGKGNEGVSGLVKQTANSIGYVELIYAVQNRIPYGKVRNAAGNFVKADLKTVTAAAAGAAANMPADFRVSIVNAPGADAYPVSSFTWLLVPSRIQNPEKARVLKDFLRWMSGPGQKVAETLSYAPLPAEVAAQVRQAVGRIP
ncbi:MAG: phosphate ABC transporter substrate-binding protein PstS [Bryobacteraceae bacterium]